MCEMANPAVIKEYLVALGVQDNMTPKLRQAFNNGTKKARQFSRGLAMAGTAAAGLLIAANTGIARFVSGLARADDEITRFATDMGKSREEAQRLHMTLSAMGHTMAEIEASPELTRKFQRLQQDAAAVQIPDMSEGLGQVRAIQTEFLRLRQAGAHAVKWVGHHLLKYLAQPMEQLRETFSGLNDRILVNLPEWTKRIASVMASVVRITATVVRGASAIFRAIKRVFDMIPAEIKLLMGALMAFSGFIRAGPIGKLIMIFTLLMMLVEDFFTYLDGGEALLGGLWRWIINLWDKINEGGGLIERLKTAFTNAMDTAVSAIVWTIDWISRLWGRLRDNGALNNFRDAFIQVGTAIRDLWMAVQSIITTLFSGFRDGAETVQPFLAWLIGVALPGAIGLIADMVSGIANLTSWFMELPIARELLLGMAAAFVAIGVVAKLNAAGGLKAFILQTKIAKGIVVALTAVKTLWAAVMKIAAVAKMLLLSPIFLIIAAVAALIAIVVLLIRNWDRIVPFFRRLWDRVISIFRAVIDAIISFFMRLLDRIRGILSSIADFFRGIWETVKGGVKAFIDGVIGFFAGLWENIVGVFSNVAEFFSNVFERASEGIRNAFSGLREFFSNLFQSIANVVRAPINAIIRGINSFIGGLNRIQIPE